MKTLEFNDDQQGQGSVGRDDQERRSWELSGEGRGGGGQEGGKEEGREGGGGEEVGAGAAKRGAGGGWSEARIARLRGGNFNLTSPCEIATAALSPGHTLPLSPPPKPYPSHHRAVTLPEAASGPFQVCAGMRDLGPAGEPLTFLDHAGVK
eukprot:767908-Hanusia_phi.AAC.5